MTTTNDMSFATPPSSVASPSAADEGAKAELSSEGEKTKSVASRILPLLDGIFTLAVHLGPIVWTVSATLNTPQAKRSSVFGNFTLAVNSILNPTTSGLFQFIDD